MQIYGLSAYDGVVSSHVHKRVWRRSVPWASRCDLVGGQPPAAPSIPAKGGHDSRDRVAFFDGKRIPWRREMKDGFDAATRAVRAAGPELRHWRLTVISDVIEMSALSVLL